MISPYDELNNLRDAIEYTAYEEDGKRKYNADDCVDLVLTALIMAYVYGVDYANETLGTDIPSDTDSMRDAIYKEIDGETFVKRVEEYAESGSIGELMRVAETEMTRDFNSGIIDTGRAVERETRVYKTWETMRDDRVRDTHDMLLGVKIPLEERFHTYDGDSAMFPGDFASAQNNVNCRCNIKVTKT